MTWPRAAFDPRERSSRRRPSGLDYAVRRAIVAALACLKAFPAKSSTFRSRRSAAVTTSAPRRMRGLPTRASSPACWPAQRRRRRDRHRGHVPRALDDEPANDRFHRDDVEPVAELLKTAPISKAAAKSFDDEVRGTIVKKVDGKEVDTTPFKDFLLSIRSANMWPAVSSAKPSFV